MSDSDSDASTALQQLYNHSNDKPATTRPLAQVNNPYASLRGTSGNKQLPTFDEAIFNKYNCSGPHYASYPTVSEGLPIPDGLEAKILGNRETRVPLALYFYMPFHHIKESRDSGGYLQYLIAEIKQKRSLLTAPENRNKPLVKQLHLAGGALTFLQDEEIVQLWQFLQTQFEFLPENEGNYSIDIGAHELGDTTLQTLRTLGFNRISLDAQDLNEAVQVVAKQAYSTEMLAHTLKEARELGFRSIAIDLTYGLPYQTPATQDKTVQHIIEMSPDRLSLLDYANLPEHFKAQQTKDEDLPSSSVKARMLGNTINTLTTTGYQYIGSDHFAKPDNELAVAQREGKLYRNVQGYTIIGDCDLLGFGVSAISQITNANSRYILQNHTDLRAYQDSIDAANSSPTILPAVKVIKTSVKDRLREYVIMNLLCHDYIDFRDVNQKFGIDAITYFIDEIQQLGEMQADRLVDMDAAGIRIMSKGRLLARNVAMVFDEYLT